MLGLTHFFQYIHIGKNKCQMSTALQINPCGKPQFCASHAAILLIAILELIKLVSQSHKKMQLITLKSYCIFH